MIPEGGTPRVTLRVGHPVLAREKASSSRVHHSASAAQAQVAAIQPLERGQRDAGKRRARATVPFDLPARAAAVLCLLVLSLSPVRAVETRLGRAEVFVIKCGDQRVAQVVPVQAGRCSLVTASQQRFPFALFHFHATDPNVRANWPLLWEQIRMQGLAGQCGPRDFTIASDRDAAETVATVLSSRRPDGVSDAPDVASEINRRTLSHDDMDFAVSRGQAFLVGAPDATRYDPGFEDGRVAGAIVFLLYPGGLIHSEVERPYLYIWDGQQYSFAEEFKYASRQNVRDGSTIAFARSRIAELAESLATSLNPVSGDPTLFYDQLAFFDAHTDRPLMVIAGRNFSGRRSCAGFKTHADVEQCYRQGTALLLVSPAAQQYDRDFPVAASSTGGVAADLRVMGAVVYPWIDPRDVVVVKWDAILREYVDLGFYDYRWDKGCRPCIGQWPEENINRIKSEIASNFSPVAEPDLVPYTTAELKYHLSHDEAAALLQRYPQTCFGLFTDVQPQGWFDEDFSPYLAGFYCDVGPLRRVWKWIPETGASYEIAGTYVIPTTDDRHAAALLRRFLGFDPTVRLDVVKSPVDKVAAQRAATAAEQAAEKDRRAAAEEAGRVRRKRWRYLRIALAIALPLFIVGVVGWLVWKFRQLASDRRIAKEQEKLDRALEREDHIIRLDREAERRLREARAHALEALEFGRKVEREKAAWRKEIGLDD
jgi:hypothetical protein